MTRLVIVALTSMSVGFALGAGAARAKFATCVMHAYRALQLVQRDRAGSPQTQAIVDDAITLIEESV